MKEYVNVYLQPQRIFLARFKTERFKELKIGDLMMLADRMTHQGRGNEVLFVFEFVESV